LPPPGIVPAFRIRSSTSISRMSISLSDGGTGTPLFSISASTSSIGRSCTFWNSAATAGSL